MHPLEKSTIRGEVPCTSDDNESAMDQNMGHNPNNDVTDKFAPRL